MTNRRKVKYMFFSFSCQVGKVKDLTLSKFHHISYKTDYKIILGINKQTLL